MFVIVKYFTFYFKNFADGLLNCLLCLRKLIILLFVEINFVICKNSFCHFMFSVIGHFVGRRLFK